MTLLSRLKTALGFLSRLVPAGPAPAGELSRSLAVFPLAGALIGAAAALPLYLGLGAGEPLVQAFFFTAVMAYLTRALHLDGLADVCDGLGSLATGERFWEILKDSRTGAFGVAGMSLALVGEVVLAAVLCRDQAFAGLAFGAAFGRGTCVVLAYLGRNLGRPGLAGEFLAGTDGRLLAAAMGWLALLAVLLFPFKALLAACVLTGIAVWRLFLLAKAQGGLNGDFLGAAIVAGELCAYAGYALARQG